MAQGVGEKTGKRWPKLILRWVIYVILSLLLMYEATHCSQIEECSGVEAPGGALSHTDYTTIVEFGTSRKPQSHRVILVTLAAGTEPDEVLSNVCAQRLFTARLIKRLNDLNVSVIAFDKFYNPKSCTREGEERATQAFVAAVRASRAVIVRGLPSVMLDHKQTANITGDSTQNPKEREVCLRETATLDLPIPASNSGLLRLDADTRRIPLRWPAFQEDGKTVKLVDSFALVAVRAIEPEVLDTPVLQQALDSGEQPYSTNIPFAGRSALAILCGRNSKNATDWEKCETDEPWSEINGAIVVVGDHSGDTDKHPSIQGLIYGVDLQANYIAALLDQRYYLPLLETVGNGIVIVVFFIVLQLLLWKFSHLKYGPLRAGLVGILLWATVLVVSILIFAFKGYLLTVWVQGINLITIIASCAEHWVATME